MLVSRAPRSTALRPFVDLLWSFEGAFAHRLERSLPRGRAQLIVNLDCDELRTYEGPALDRVTRTGGAILEGPRDRAVGIDTAEQRAVVGVSFEVGGTAPFFRDAASALAGRHLDLELLWGRAGATLRARLLEAPSAPARLDVLEAALLARAERLDPDPAVRAAAARLSAGERVGAVADALGWSTRRLQRRFEANVGLAPKRFARVARLSRTVEALAQGAPADGWAGLAVRLGFYDQAHLIRDLRKLAGITPTAYAPRSPEDAHHVVLE